MVECLLNLPELFKPKLIGRLAAVGAVPLVPGNDGVIDSLAVIVGVMPIDAVGVVPVPLIVDKMATCICWTFFWSFSFCVSANLTTNGAEHPSIVWLWFNP